jgi:hypothetical protein
MHGDPLNAIRHLARAVEHLDPTAKLSMRSIPFSRALAERTALTNSGRVIPSHTRDLGSSCESLATTYVFLS